MPLFHSDQRNPDLGAESRPSWFADTELPLDGAAAGGAAFEAARRARADTIAWELSTGHEFDRVPALVQDFLFGPWSLVLAHAELAGSGEARRYQGAIADLLWSVKHDVSLRSPGEWLKRVPPLLATLREGLGLLGQVSEVHEPFFEGLMKLHRPVLQLRRARSRRDARDSTSPRDFEETMPADSEGFAAECIDAVLAAGPEHDPGEAPAAAAGVPDAAALVLGLEPGQPADLWCESRWLRAQLTWVSSEHAFFLFVSEGGRQHSMTRRSCERLIRAGQLKLLPTGEDRPALAG